MSSDSHIAVAITLNPARTGSEVIDLVCDIVARYGESLWATPADGDDSHSVVTVGQLSPESHKNVRIVEDLNTYTLTLDRAYDMIYIVNDPSTSSLDDGSDEAAAARRIVNGYVAQWARDFRKHLHGELTD